MGKVAFWKLSKSEIKTLVRITNYLDVESKLVGHLDDKETDTYRNYCKVVDFTNDKIDALCPTDDALFDDLYYYDEIGSITHAEYNDLVASL